MSDHIAQYLRDRAGELHRMTVRYDRGEREFLYVRDDLDEGQLRDQVDRLLDRSRPAGPDEGDAAFAQFGELEATVHVFEEAVVLRFPDGRQRGVLVSLEVAAARELSTFVVECRQRLGD